MNKSLIIVAGGTAGHIYPAVGLIEFIKIKYPDIKIGFIGTQSGMEKNLIKGMDIEFWQIRASGFSMTSGIIKKIDVYCRFLFNLVLGFFKALKIIKSFKPFVILGMGGYICAPVFIAAKICRKKIAIHEQNFIPGRLNKFFSKFSSLIFVSFKDSIELFKKINKNKSAEIIYSGNPLRQKVLNFYKIDADYNLFSLEKDRKTIVAFGGSLGAQKINKTVVTLYDYFRNEEKLQFLLISGERFYESLVYNLKENFSASDKLIFKIYPFIYDMEKIYRIADLIIARAGATTIAELDYTRTPAILIPYPQAIENHQYYNALYLVGKNIAFIINDSELTVENLLKGIKKLSDIDSLNVRINNFKKGVYVNFNSSQIMTEKILANI